MKKINLYATGKYNSRDNSGYWVYYLEWNGAVLKRSGLCDTNCKLSIAKVTLYSIYNALNAVKEPCIINIHTPFNVGLNNVKNSPNKDYIKSIHDLIINAGHQVSWDLDYDKEKIEQWERKYSRNNIEAEKEKREQLKRQKEEQEEYDKFIEKQAMEAEDWRAMYSDLMGPSQGCWVPGSGGY